MDPAFMYDGNASEYFKIMMKIVVPIQKWLIPAILLRRINLCVGFRSLILEIPSVFLWLKFSHFWRDTK